MNLDFFHKFDTSNELIDSRVKSYRNWSLLAEGREKQLYRATKDDKEVVLKFVADPIEAQNELCVLEELNGRYHVVKLFEYLETDTCMLFVMEYKQPVEFSPKTVNQIVHYAFQVMEVIVKLS
jgi:serine/threonine protein kinase